MITEQPGEVFKYDNHAKEFVVARLDPQLEYPKYRTHLSAPGKPWKKGGWNKYQESLKAKSPAAVSATSSAAVNKVSSSAVAPKTSSSASQTKPNHTPVRKLAKLGIKSETRIDAKTNQPEPKVVTRDAKNNPVILLSARQAEDLSQLLTKRETLEVKPLRRSDSQERLMPGLFSDDAVHAPHPLSSRANKKRNDAAAVVVKAKPDRLIADIEIHILKLESGDDSFLLGDRRRQKIQVLKAAKELLEQNNSLKNLDDVKQQNPKWDSALGESEVVKLVNRAVDYFTTSQAESGMRGPGRK